MGGFRERLSEPWCGVLATELVKFIGVAPPPPRFSVSVDSKAVHCCRKSFRMSASGRVSGSIDSERLGGFYLHQNWAIDERFRKYCKQES